MNLSLLKVMLTILTLFYLSPVIPAQTNLQYYIDKAKSNNATIKESEDIIKSKRLEIDIQKAQYSLPQISLTANYLFAPYFNNNKLISTNPDPNAIGYDVGITNGGEYSALLNLNQNLLYNNVINKYKNLTNTEIESSKFNIELTNHNLIKDVTEAYLNAYQAQELYYISKNIIDTIITQFNITKALMERGLVKQSDYLLLSVELQDKKTNLEQNHSDWRSSEYQLYEICNIPDTTLRILEEPNLTLTGDIENSSFLKQYDLDSSNIINQQLVSETQYDPQLNLIVNAGLNASELSNIQRKFGMSIGINFTLPIYNGNQKELTREQSLTALNTVRNYKQNQIITNRNNILRLKEQIKTLNKNIAELTKEISDYDNIKNIIKSEMLRGQLSIIEYLTIIRNYTDLQTNLLSSRIKYQQTINQFNNRNW